MSEQDYEQISTQHLRERVGHRHPNNRHPSEGYALVNVLSEDAFDEEHIPNSINIPQGQEEEFDRLFEPDKEIIVYCASHECDASPTTAEELAERGFRNVKDYSAGIEGWKEAGGPVARDLRP